MMQIIYLKTEKNKQKHKEGKQNKNKILLS